MPLTSLEMCVLLFRYVLTLDADRKFSVICGITGFTLRESDERELPMLDVVFLQGDNETAQLFVVLKDRESKGLILRILSFPGKLFIL